jgi:aminoglycoside 6'-N-acetyltransferase I
MKVRVAAEADRAEWLRMLLALYPGSSGMDHEPAIAAYLNDRPSRELIPAVVYVLERQGGGLGGFLELSVRNYAEGCSGATPYVESWFVDEDLRGTGAGRALMGAAEQWARGQGYAELASDALVDNLLSHAAHAALGFEEVERVVHFRKAL